MLQCPGCAANIRFDIERQKMYCSSCGCEYEPSDFPAVSKIRTETILECPQCGGEMLADDTEAAVFCSYCGASNILTKRMQKQGKKIRYILPFQVSKAACKRRYRNWLSRNFFASAELRDPKNIESFRAIYMPYWTYTFRNTNTVKARATKKNKKSGYEYTYLYDATAEANIEFSGLNHDASSSFSDHLSEAVAPFHEQDRKDFSEAYLSGFYADLADVDEKIYEKSVARITGEASADEFLRLREVRKYTVKRDDIINPLTPSCVSKELVLLPVWFLCNRIKSHGVDRVSYAVINGQTGKAAGDTPIDLKKFFTFAGLLSVALFLVLQVFGLLTIQPKTLMIISCVFSVLMAKIFVNNEEKILARENRTDDAGFLYMAKKTHLIQTLDDEPKKKKVQTEPATSTPSRAKTSASAQSATTTTSAAPVAYPHKTLWRTTLWWIPIAVTFLIYFINPIQDFIYYLGAILCIAAVVRILLMSILHFNLLCTRPLPQFKRTGGDDSAKI